MSAPRIDPHVLAASGYVPDWRGMDRGGYLCLDRNESTRPLPRRVADAVSRHLFEAGVNLYPDDSVVYPQLAEYCGVPPSHLLLTNGSDQAIDITLRGFLREGDELLIATPEFAIFRLVAGLAGAAIAGVPYEEDLSFPYESFRAAAAARPRVIAFINPNNPTGTPVDLDFIEEIVVAYPDIPVIVDEAYYEFTRSTAAPLVRSHENVIVFRTFSKAFAMAGLRVGYVIASPTVIQEIAKIRNPFDVNSLAAVAARAHLEAAGEVLDQAAEVADRIKPAVVDALTGLGVPVVDGAGNFILVKPENCPEAIAFLREAGILVKSMTGRLEGMFRASMGTKAEMDRFCRVYHEYHQGTAMDSASAQPVRD